MNRLTQNDKIFLAGHNGLVGSAIHRTLIKYGYNNIITRNFENLDLTNAKNTYDFIESTKPTCIIIAAAKVGGILANSTYPADFIRENLLIQDNLINAAFKNGITKLLFLGSSCIYPKLAPQPIKEEYLLSSPLEPTNEAYAIAKIAGLKLCLFTNQQYKTRYLPVMPTNLYGPNDNYDLKSSHVVPAIIRKCHEAKINNLNHITLWGTGTALREFLYVDDLADACIFLLEKTDTAELINIGTGIDLTIHECATTIANIVGFKGEILYDNNYPDGTPRKCLDISKLKKLGWTPRTTLQQGIQYTYEDFLQRFHS